MRFAYAALFAMSLAAASGTPAMADGDAEKGAKVFRVCMACHRVGPGARTVVGPQLNGVVGRKAGSLEGYPYSAAMKESGLTWDEATLGRYLKKPSEVVPKTRMIYPGLRKDADVADVIAYLKTFDANGNPVAPATQ